MNLASNLLWLIIAYLIGSIPTAYIVGRRVSGIDIREHGSGNVGATNAFRVIGKQWGSAVLAIDLLKGLVVTAVIARGAHAFPGLSLELKQLIFGFAAISGHTWTLWLKLKGGKGIATAAGVLLGIFPVSTICAVLIWSLLFVVKRYVSLASIGAVAVFPILLLLFSRHIESFWLVFLISLVLAGLLIYNHRSNIQRLQSGAEPRVNFSKKENAGSG
jgi:acyl phosphate:glycerol-3-phosphate acyltransferase